MSDKKIVVDGLTKSFFSNQGALPVINGVSFSVDDGEFVAIVGPSGCGKSTLMNIIAGFERQDFGWVKVDGVERALAKHYAAMVGLKGFEAAYPHELSGGMLKRVELARALVVKPEILYMDEPFSALDALMNLRMRHELQRILGEERHTVLLITHDVEEAIYMADRIVVLSPRPTRIQASFQVDLPHPRRIGSAEAQALREAILAELGL